ncbi:HNH endonuclease [Chryseobacterium indoltheticum]|nr:HNH endonuclease [Chryseobacterium indoltheticum]
MKVKELDEYTIAKVLYSYLVEEKSHRVIQSEILCLPAPLNGGGYVAMEILHYFNIKGNSKGLLKNNLDYIETINSEAKEILNSFYSISNEAKNLLLKKNINPQNKKTERLQLVKSRIYQDVLKYYTSMNYNKCCALCQIDQPELLVASHIIPWSVDEDKRLDLDNCILLCNFHDKLFDKGFISLDENFNLIISKKLSRNVVNLLENSFFKTPKEYLPNQKYLKLHREDILRK